MLVTIVVLGHRDFTNRALMMTNLQVSWTPSQSLAAWNSASASARHGRSVIKTDSDRNESGWSTSVKLKWNGNQIRSAEPRPVLSRRQHRRRPGLGRHRGRRDRCRGLTRIVSRSQ